MDTESLLTSHDKGTARSRKKSIQLALVALIIFSIGAILLTWPLVTDMSRDFFNPGLSHDGVGTIAQTWYTNYSSEHHLPSDRTDFYSYPFGVSTRGIRYPLTNGFMEVAARAFGAQAGYNILMLISFPMAGLIMYLLLYYLTGSFAASVLGGFIFAFSPWHVARSFDQPALGQIYLLPLFLLAVIYVWKKPGLLSAGAVAGVMLLAIMTDLHLALFCGFVGIVWAVAVFLAGRRKGRRFMSRPSTWVNKKGFKSIVLAVVAVMIAGAIATPVLINLFYKDPAVINETGERSIEVTSSYSSRPWNYVVPPAYALIWRSWTRDFVTDHLGRSGVHEVTAYPGIITAFLAGCAVYFTFRKKKPRKGACEDSGEDEPPADGPVREDDDRQGEAERGGSRALLRTCVFYGIIASVLAFMLSMPPLLKIGSVSVPTPSIIMRAIAPFFRFYSRWSLVVNFALALLAAVGFLYLSRTKWFKGWRAAGLCVALIALFIIDTTIIPPFRSRDITDVPKAVNALEKENKTEPVVFYPLSPGRYFIPQQYFYYQTFAQHPMLNGTKPGTTADLYQAVLKDVYAPYTARMLAGLGIKKAVIFPEYFKIMSPVGLDFDPSMMPEGYKLSRKFVRTTVQPGGKKVTTPDSYIYDVTAAPTKVFPLYYTNLSTPVILEDGAAWSVMLRPECELLIQNDEGPVTRDFWITVQNNGPPGTVSAKLDGRAIGRVSLPEGKGELFLPGLRLGGRRHTLSLAWDGQPNQIEGKAIGTEGIINAYLIFSRPGFNEGAK